MPNYLELLEREQEFRLSEQSALINSLLVGTASRGKLSLLRRAGLAMTGLEVVGRRGGIGGRIIIELNGMKDGSKAAANKDDKYNKDSHATKAPPHKQSCFKPGDLVKLIASGKLLDCTGTIEKSPRDIDVSISIDSADDSEEMETINSNKISIVKIVDEVGMFEKMKGNLEALERADRNDLQSFIKEFIGNIGRAEIAEIDDFESLNVNNGKSIPLGSGLNWEQEIAVGKSLEMISENPRDNLVLIHGPPGTGKTSVLVELIKRLRDAETPLRILVCGPSNLSVDNILERIKTSNSSQKILRIGHPSRVLESCQGNTLDFWCENSDAGQLLKDVQVEIDSILKSQLPRCKSREERRAIFGELKELRRERRTRERKLQIDLIDGAEIVFCTLGTACGKKLRNSKKKFDLAIVDEAGQALLPEILIAPILAEKLILAGDHFQLPPTVMNPEIKSTLQVSLFEHLIANKLPSTAMLKEQYRMNELIMQWSNAKFYKGQLRASETVANWKLDCEGGEDVLIFYDTCGFDLWESTESSGEGLKGILFEGKNMGLIYFL